MSARSARSPRCRRRGQPLVGTAPTRIVTTVESTVQTTPATLPQESTRPQLILPMALQPRSVSVRLFRSCPYKPRAHTRPLIVQATVGCSRCEAASSTSIQRRAAETAQGRPWHRGTGQNAVRDIGHSQRNVARGSTRVARRAGMQVAASATARRPSHTPVNTTMS